MSKTPVTTDFLAKTSTLESPAGKAFDITPSDDELANFTRAIYVGTGGDLKVVMAGDEDDDFVTFENVANGTILPLRVRKVLEISGSSTGSSDSANSIIGLY